MFGIPRPSHESRKEFFLPRDPDGTPFSVAQEFASVFSGSPRRRCPVLLLTGICLASLFIGATRSPATGSDSDTPSASQCASAGRAAFDNGQFDEAVAQWRTAARLCEANGDDTGRMEALINLGNAYESLGQQTLAVSVLEKAVHLAESSGDNTRLALAKNSLGAAGTSARQFGPAEQDLRESLAMARGSHDTKTAASALNNLGNLLADQGKTADALDAFQESASLAQQTTNDLLAARALGNAAATALRAGQTADAARLNGAALGLLRDLPPSHDLAFLLVGAAQTDWQLNQHSAEAACRQALLIAEKISDERAKTYALGMLGRIYESQHDYDKALSATRQAAFIAQQIQAPDALYRWEWQTGRLHKEQGDRAAAIAAYRRAEQSLRFIRHDLGYGSCAACAPFREAVGPLYLELADLLLQQAESLKDEQARQQTLLEARDTVEQLKSVELEDYFEDECVSLLRAKTTRIETISPTTAVIYIITLPDRTVLLVGLTSGLTQFSLPVGEADLTAEIRLFRTHLEKRTTNEYLAEAQQLYRWLITPIKDTLAAHHIDTLVFVPDSALRTIPMAALHDGDHFLIEQFAVAETPGLTLMAPRPISRDHIHALTGGLSIATQGFPALPYVSAELQQVHALFGGPDLANADFVIPKLEKDFSDEQFSIVHFATHGQFDRNAGDSFILTYDGKLTLDRLEDMIRPGQYRGQPVELLTLSACQTAAGDDRAALGLAGVAVKAGARSALATLWFVNDESTATLITDFYKTLRNEKTFSKAKALQQAQIKLIADPRYDHPCYWAAFVMIGNWL